MNDTIEWEDFDPIAEKINKWLPERGEGDNMATQAVTSISKIVYKWFNDGDVYDNNYYLDGWVNDLSSYANWLYNKLDIWRLKDISEVYSEQAYTNLLYDIATMFTEEYLEELEKQPAEGSIYTEEGPFVFTEHDDEEEYDEDYEDEW